MKFKVLGAFMLVLGIAGAAAAYPHYGYGYGAQGPRGDWRGPRPELSQEDRAHFDAMRKIRTEIRDELNKEKPDKQRARTLFAKELDLRQEYREKGFRDCIENHDHSRGRCGWIARHDRRMGYGNTAWVNFINEISKDNPNKVRAWEYFSEAEKTYRQFETERFNAMLDDPDGWRGWHGGPRDGRFGPRGGWNDGQRDGRWAPRHHWGGHYRPGCGPDGWHGGPRCWDGPAY
ncbi:periplasmic heavy metal sensor [Cloacibacillus sp. An23]|uniref:periplasmic heavy metal sensor n=1 Tax=Cloacibacillus sp. An23 TaxID=1965591 RepID=UPI000B3A752F|nr:periplasmic heavy metal sensor [Cloacibacillus sp. An23]OUO92672.1 hypothetical protein B5F39_11020 [Cloacibacillus sp. An23]